MNDLAKHRTNLLQILDDMGFLARVNRKPYVLVPGLLWLFYSKGGGQTITTEILHHDPANLLCVQKATLTGVRGGITYTATGIGDAGKASCAPQILPSYIRMAETRATGRALRHYLGIGMCTLEELPIYEEDEHGQNTTPNTWNSDSPSAPKPQAPKSSKPALASAQDKDEILLLAAKNNMDDAQLAAGIKKRHEQGLLKASTFATLTAQDAKSIIIGLRESATDTTTKTEN